MLTEKRGRRSFIIGGVRKASSKVSAGLLSPMSLVEIVAYDRPDRELNRLKEVRPAFVYQRLPFELVRGTIGLFMVEMLQKTIRDSSQDSDFFEFVFNNFKGLDQSEESVSNWHLSFSLHLAGCLGFAPSGEWSEAAPYFDLKYGQYIKAKAPSLTILDASLSQLFGRLLNCSPSESHLASATRAERLQLTDAIVSYFRMHIEGFSGLNCLDVLKHVMGDTPR